jgi:hypothetical protein
MKLSARNVFKGKVLDIKIGPIASKVRVDIGGAVSSPRRSPPMPSTTSASPRVMKSR